MELQDAKDQLHKFVHLKGYHSKHYDSAIEEVFVSFRNPVLAATQYDAYKKGLNPFKTIPSDKGNFTIVAALENGKIVSIKSIVKADNLQDLNQDADALDYAL